MARPSRIWAIEPPTASAEADVELLRCRHGTMLAFRSDEVIGRSLRLYGEWSEHELSYLRRYVTGGTLVVDVGAHIGTHTLAFAKWVLSGAVIAVEPQAVVSSVLQVNCLLNGIRNVEIVNAACGNRGGEAFVESSDPGNLGAAAFSADTGLLRKLHRLLSGRAGPAKGSVPVVRVDDLVGNRPVSLIKIDAEGMEFGVLRGAKAVLRESHPAIFCEQNDVSQVSAIHDLLIGFNYRLYWLETHQFNKANFRGEPDNIWWRTETGILAVHESFEQPDDLVTVDKSATAIPSRYNAREGVLVA